MATINGTVKHPNGHEVAVSVQYRDDPNGVVIEKVYRWDLDHVSPIDATESISRNEHGEMECPWLGQQIRELAVEDYEQRQFVRRSL